MYVYTRIGGLELLLLALPLADLKGLVVGVSTYIYHYIYI